MDLSPITSDSIAITIVCLILLFYGVWVGVRQGFRRPRELLNPLRGVAINWSQLYLLFFAESIFTLDAYRHHIFPNWGLNWEKIQASQREGTFNVYNFSKHLLRPVTAPEMTEDFLVAAASLSL